jgi:hypothetical protein
MRPYTMPLKHLIESFLRAVAAETIGSGLVNATERSRGEHWSWKCLTLLKQRKSIDPETANSQDKNAKTRRFHKWSVKKLLPRRK